MQYSKILVAYDGSRASRKALETARDLIDQNPEAKALFVHVVKLYGVGAAQADLDAALVQQAQELIEELESFAEMLDGRGEVRILKGSSPSELILKCAREESVDLIIMGSRGMGGIKGYLGSVSRGVVQDAEARVLIVKEEAAVE